MKVYNVNNTCIIFLNLNDLLTFKRGHLKKIKEEYLRKYDNCIIYNYFDLINHKKLIKDKINKLKFIDQNKIHARKCNITQIENNTKNEFLNENHIQGADKSQISFGAYYNDRLIAVLSFDKNKRINGGLNNNIYNLSRFSVKAGVLVVGIFNRLLKEFITIYEPHKIISFGDLTYVNKHNNIYKTNGFKLTNISQPDYKFYHHHKKKLYHKLSYGLLYIKRNGLSEVEQDKLYNEILTKVWDCGKLRYELFLNKELKAIYGFIYKITNKINNKIYIGQTTRTLNSRMSEYKKSLLYDEFYNTYLHDSFKKYGFDNFKFEIIDTAESIDDLNIKEIRYIKEYNSIDKNIGYNLEFGGRNAIPNEDTLKKMSISHTGIKQTESWIAKRVAKSGTEEAKKYGRTKTDEEKKYLSEISPKYWEGKKRSDETKKKISQTKLERGLSDKQKKIICKRVIAYNPNTEKVINIFDSTNDAAKQYSISQSTISRRCSGKSKNTGNVYFKFE